MNKLKDFTVKKNTEFEERLYKEFWKEGGMSATDFAKEFLTQTILETYDLVKKETMLKEREEIYRCSGSDYHLSACGGSCGLLLEVPDYNQAVSDQSAKFNSLEGK